jgi:YidC/Oxa1 family membrane protein insertase
VRKTYTFDEGTYSFDLDVSVEDSLGRRLPHWIAWGAGLEGTEDDVKEDQSYFSAPYYSNKRKEEKKLGDLQKAKRDSLPGMFDWAGVRTKYFVAAMIPRDSRGTMVHWAVEAGTSRIETSLKNPDGHQYRIYAGPVEYRSLKGVGVGMETLCDYGWTWIRPVSRVMLEILLFLHRYLKNYGLVIIVFSILMRVVFFPLTFQSLKSMQAMQRLSPKMNKLREQFKDDPARLNREMMSLYRKQRVNPLGGCLPMIIQIPIFFALYSLLRATIEMRRAPFMLWIQDFSLMDPYYVLPVVMGASMFLQQKLMTQDPR